MCGIFGIHVANVDSASRADLIPALRSLFLLSESRGKEASGLLIRTRHRIDILKSPERAKYFVRDELFRKCVEKAISDACNSDSAITFIGHSRLVTNGSEDSDCNNQPVKYDDTICVHNGIVVNDTELWEENPAVLAKNEVDSEVIAALINERSKAHSFDFAVAETCAMLEGSASIAVIHRQVNEFVLSTNTGSLYFSNSGAPFVFASEHYILNRFRKNHSRIFTSPEIRRLEPRNLLKYDITASTCHVHAWETVGNSGGRNETTNEISISSHKVASNKRKSSNMRTLSQVSGRVVPADIEAAFTRRSDKVNSLVRCSKCVLPETMPFINFDEAGVCNFCRNYKPVSVLGEEQLRQLADKHRSRDGSPDCIAAVSGGRDSTYGLHYLKRVLGLTPIAYTYDWGMVTDLARRNLARITGKLGVEHIIVSADIQRKRANIAGNIKAWLKRPDLGMIPLFMAGDKQFYYFANVIKKQTGVPLLFFSAGNEMEATGFKTGFCGIRNGAESGLLATLPLASKFQLLWHYGKNFALNWAYISPSLVDTAHAFASSYLISHDYHYLFHYLYWDEKEIINVLADEYQWQLASDTTATWRIGDGTAAFYNYIYFMIGGLTENDTFRSNQIREGKIDRSTALELVRGENRPRYDTLQEYFDQIGLDFESTLRKINEFAPKFDS